MTINKVSTYKIITTITFAVNHFEVPENKTEQVEERPSFVPINTK